ncbi:hypothetical protein LPE509_02077 [Legionella pneumophila subsp. pneumophila LPE509]|nr:hypothetical protein LPE509_02077 [Legionella pneumophila subsp. pneumophila LPE509]
MLVEQGHGYENNLYCYSLRQIEKFKLNLMRQSADKWQLPNQI